MRRFVSYLWGDVFSLETASCKLKFEIEFNLKTDRIYALSHIWSLCALGEMHQERE